MQRQGDTPLSERYGTFLRTVARDRPDLEFFSVGHPLVDALGFGGAPSRSRTHIRRLACEPRSQRRAQSCSRLARARSTSGWARGVPELALRRLGRRVVWVAVDLATGDVLAPAVTPKLSPHS